MQIKPVKQPKQPAYPTFEYYMERPELLYRNMPESWLKNRCVATSLAAFVLLGCSDSKSVANPLFSVCHSAPDAASPATDKGACPLVKAHNDEKQDSIKIAPIFVHGEGSGAIGCEVMSPPVFISEDEARKIIFDALRKEGITFDTLNCPEIKFKARPIANDCPYNIKKDVKLKMDGYNKELNLAIQFVSKKDFDKLEPNCDSTYYDKKGREIKAIYISSVQEYDTKKAAEIVREALVTDGKTNAVVFYDPITYINYDYEDKSWEESKKEAKNKAKKLLLKQVEDFIKWLRQENLITE